MVSTWLRVGFLTIITLVSATIVTAQNFTIEKIEFEGLNKQNAADITALAGLKSGEAFNLEALDAAAQRLIDSGFFKKVAYRTRATKRLMTITFIVEEAKLENSRVVFDNFIWFTDTELMTAIQQDLPNFTGTAPDTGDTILKIVKALQRFLHENKIEATVEHMISQDGVGSKSQEHVFSVNGIPMPICTLHFPGFENVPESKLIEKSQAMRGGDYSAKFVSAYAGANLIPIYRELGHLKAVFAPPLAKLEESATCKNGVDVTVSIYEGAIYNFNKAEWEGNQNYTADELSNFFGMKTGELANGLKMDQARGQINAAYGRKGYLTASVKSVSEFNDEARKVTLKFKITEGPQYLMGSLIPKGFNETETKQILAKWGLKTGAVYDDSYSKTFSKVLTEILMPRALAPGNQGKSGPAIKWNLKPNRETLTVDLIVELVSNENKPAEKNSP